MSLSSTSNETVDATIDATIPHSKTTYRFSTTPSHCTRATTLSQLRLSNNRLPTDSAPFADTHAPSHVQRNAGPSPRTHPTEERLSKLNATRHHVAHGDHHRKQRISDQRLTIGTQPSKQRIKNRIPHHIDYRLRATTLDLLNTSDKSVTLRKTSACFQLRYLRYRDHVIRLTSFTSLGLRHSPYVIGIPSSSLRHPPSVIRFTSSRYLYLRLRLHRITSFALRHRDSVIHFTSLALRHSPYVIGITSASTTSSSH